MTAVERIRAEFVEFVPQKLESGVLYISRKYKTASHLCCCGCGNKVVTPLKPGGWQLAVERDLITLDPSIGSWSLPCQSHYFIRGSRIVWAPKWSQSAIQEGRRSDQLARERYFAAQAETNGLLPTILRWFSKFFRAR